MVNYYCLGFGVWACEYSWGFGVVGIVRGIVWGLGSMVYHAGWELNLVWVWSLGFRAKGYVVRLTVKVQGSRVKGQGSRGKRSRV